MHPASGIYLAGRGFAKPAAEAEAVEDAYVLAEALAREPAPEEAFAAYQRVRRAKAVRIVTMSRRLGRLAHLEAPWARILRNLLLRSVPEGVNRRQMNALYALNY